MASNLTSAIRAPRADRVRANTRKDINRRLDSELEHRLRLYATQDKAAITDRIAELDREWDIERVVEAHAAGLILFSLLMGATRKRIWFLLPVAVSAFLLRFAIQGWYPPLPVLRKLGVRTRLEIEQERYALKLLRGDFNHLDHKKGEPLRDATTLVRGLAA